MLVSLATPVSPISSPPAVGDGEIVWLSRQVVVPAFQLLQVGIVNEPFLPQMLEQVEVWPRGAQRFAEDRVMVRNVIHPPVPRVPAIRVCVFKVFTKRAFDRLWRLFASEVTETVCPPLFLIQRKV